MLTLQRANARADRGRARKAGGFRRFWRSEAAAGYLFISPWIIGFLAFQLYPLLDTIYNSFNKLGLFGDPVWVGWENYQKLFSQDADFKQALVNMLLFIICSTVIYIVGGLILALAVQKNFPGSHIFRVIYYLPSLMVGVGIGAMMVQVFNAENYGLINWVLGFFHVPPVQWLQNYDHPIMSMVALILVTFWFMGGAMLIFIAGLKGISQTYYDAARMDGANAWHRFRKITLPLLTPVLLFNTVMTLLGNIQAFALPLIFSGGGSGSVGSVTSVLGYRGSLAMFLTYLYQEGFINHHYGYASALAMVIFVISLILTAVVLVIFQRFTYYQGANEE